MVLAANSGDILMAGNAALNGGAIWGNNSDLYLAAATSYTTYTDVTPSTSRDAAGGQIVLANNAAVRQGGAIGDAIGRITVGNPTTERVQMTGNWTAQLGRTGGGAIFSTSGFVAVYGCPRISPPPKAPPAPQASSPPSAAAASLPARARRRAI